MIDLDQMGRGAKFQDLKRSYIIFICLENLFPQKGMHKYSFQSMCQEDPGLELGDDAVKIILSAKGDKDDVSEDLKDFLTYVAGGRPGSGLTSRLDEQVRKARSHIEWRKEYMTLLERDERMREEGRKEGLEEGLKNGIEKGRQEERENTLRESARANAAEKEAARLRAELEALRRSD